MIAMDLKAIWEMSAQMMEGTAVRRMLGIAYRGAIRPYHKARIAALSLRDLINRPTHAGLPVPPPRLRQLTTAGHDTVKEHIENGRQGAAMLDDAINRHSVAPKQIESVLDFGCGCGRILRHISGLWQYAKLHGSDVDDELIRWNRANLPDVADWHINDYLPPLDFSDHSLDIIYAVSVFTHMNEETQLAWLKEFRRVLKPEGIALLTIRLRMTEGEDSDGVTMRYRRNEIADRTWLKQKSELPHYIDAQHSEHYCRSVWGENFEVIEIKSGALRQAQALVVMKPR